MIIGLRTTGSIQSAGSYVDVSMVVRQWSFACEWVKKMANRINLSHADVAKIIEAPDSEEVSEYESNTSYETESESSDNDFDINNQQMNSKKYSVQES
ncbi:hypothetical protein TNCV_3152861 [Trichonephila clavipes]|nr:hypothetical protein TNCV_3152861 [Trichonephila clavipes]